MGAEILREARAIAVVDWPSKDVPDSLARAGLEVSVHGGPEPDAWSIQEVGAEGDVVGRHTGKPPESAEVVYSHRPLQELDAILAIAKQVGAKTVWVQSGKNFDGERDARGTWLSEEDRSRARAAVEGAGFTYVDDVYIGDAARARL